MKKILIVYYRSNLKKVKLFLLSRVPPEILIVILLKMG